MTTPPFSGFDFQDQLDSVARNLTGNQFRLSRTDPDAGQKFSEFLDRGAQAFEAAGRPQAAQMSVPNLTPPTVAPVVDQTRSAQPVFPVSQTPVDISTLREQASPALMSDLERSAAREISAFPTSPQQDHQNFIDHELFEASLVRDGVSPEEAHARAAERFGEGVDIQALTSEGSARLKELFGSDFNVDAFARSHEVRKAALAALGEGRPQTDPAGQRRAAILAEQQAQADARAAAQPSQSLISTFFNQTPLGRIALSASDLAQAQADEAAGAFRLAGGVLPDQILGREPIGLTQRETEFDRVFQEARSRGLRLSDAFREAAAVQQHLPVGEEQTGRHGVSGFLEGLGSALRGELGQTNIERQPLFEVGTADIGAAIADPLNVLPGVGEAGQIARGTRVVGRGTRQAAGAAGRAGRQIPDIAASVGAAAERAGLPSPVSVARAAEDVPSAGRRRTIDELRAAGGEPEFSIQVNAPGTFGDIAPREVNASNVADIRRRLEALIDPQGRGLPHQGRVIATKIEREGFESLSRTERDIAQDVIVRNLEPGERLTAAELRTGAERIINEAQESLVALDDAVANAEADVIQRGIDRIGANEPPPASVTRTADDVPPRLPEQVGQPFRRVVDDFANSLSERSSLAHLDYISKNITPDADTIAEWQRSSASLRKHLQSLSDDGETVVAYRSSPNITNQELESWTLDRSRAQGFSNLHSQGRLPIREERISINDVVAPGADIDSELIVRRTPAPQQAVQPQVADDAALRTIEDAQVSQPPDLPSDAGGKIPPRIATAADEFTRPPGGDLPPLQDFETQLGVAFNPNLARRVGELASQSQIARPLTGFDPSLTAKTPGQRAAVGLANLLEEGNLKSDRIFSYAGEVGDRRSLFGSDLDRQTGLFQEGDFAGRSLNEVREGMDTEFAERLQPAQREYLNRLGELDEKASELARRSGRDIGLTEDDDILFGSRRIYAKIDPETGQVIKAEPIPSDRPVAGKMAAERARTVRTAKELTERGFVLLPYDETVRIKLKQAYRVAAEAELDKWVRANYEFENPVSPRDFANSQKRLYKGQFATTEEGQRFVDDLDRAITQLQETALIDPLTGRPVKLRIGLDIVNQVGRTAALTGDASIFLIQFLLAMGKDVLPVTAQGGLSKIRPKVPGALFGTTSKSFATQLVNGMISPSRAKKFNNQLLQNNRDLLSDTRSLIMFGDDATPEITEGVSKVHNIADYLDSKGGIRGAAGRAVGRLARPLDAFQQATSAAMNAAGVHMFKSLKHLTKNADGTINPQALQDVEDFVNNFRGITSSARLGVAPKRRWQEGLVALAPRYRRATAALYTSAAQGGLRGQLAREAIASGVLGLTMTWIGLLTMKGQSEGWSKERTQQEIKDTLNPNSGKFMVTEVAGQMVGPGSKLISDLKFGSRIIGNPGALLDLHPERNPAIRWLRSQGSFALSTPTDIIAGRDVVGNVTRPGAPIFGGDDPTVSDGLMGLTKEISGLGIMLWLQSALFEGGTAKQKAIRAGADFAGARAYEQGRTQILDDASWEQFGKPLDQLNQLERFNLQQTPELAQALFDLDEARANSGDKFAGYRVRRTELEEFMRGQQALDLEDFIIDVYSGEKSVKSAIFDLKELTSKTKGTNAARLDEFRIQNGFEGYTGEEPTNEFDRALNGWYDLIDEHTQKITVRGEQVNGRLNLDTWLPAAEEYLAGLPPEIRSQMEQWRSRKEDIPGIKELVALVDPVSIDPVSGKITRKENDVISAEIGNILREIGITQEQLQELLRANR